MAFDPRVLGDYIRRRREVRDIDQATFAREMQAQLPEEYWDQSLVSKWERGQRARPTEAQMRAVARILGISLVDLYIASGMLSADDLVAWTKQPAPGLLTPPDVLEELSLPPDLTWDEAVFVREYVRSLRRAAAEVSLRSEEEGEDSPRRLPVRA